MSSVLVFTGGPDHAHDFDATGAALAELFLAEGHAVELVAHPEQVPAAIDELRPDVVVVNALWWRMLGDKYDPWRPTYGYAITPSVRRCLGDFVAEGGGLVGSHTASICFDDWPQWRQVLGGAWNWERSWHPPPAPVAITVERTHPVVDGLPATFHLVDEVFGDLDVLDGIEVLACAHRSPDDAAQPVVWVHRHGRGRVVYDAFGHDAASITDPVHARLLRQAVEWAGGGS